MKKPYIKLSVIGNVGKPYISVIITAYDRKKYLLGAVQSALNQTLPKDLYEVIVIKNFRDETIDRQLEKWGSSTYTWMTPRKGASS